MIAPLPALQPANAVRFGLGQRRVWLLVLNEGAVDFELRAVQFDHSVAREVILAAREELDQLVTARRGLSRLRDKIDNWGEHEQPRAVQKAYQALLREVERQQARLEALIADRIEKTEHFAERAEIIQSVPGLAGNSAAALLAFLPELSQVDRQAASALLGVAPFDDDSGKRRGHRHIQGGRRKLRCLLFTPILGAATRHNPVLKACYRRLIAKGKAHKVALVACMRKLVCIFNIMLARGEKWDPARHALA